MNKTPRTPGGYEAGAVDVDALPPPPRKPTVVASYKPPVCGRKTSRGYACQNKGRSEYGYRCYLHRPGTRKRKP